MVATRVSLVREQYSEKDSNLMKDSRLKDADINVHTQCGGCLADR